MLKLKFNASQISTLALPHTDNKCLTPTSALEFTKNNFYRALASLSFQVGSSLLKAGVDAGAFKIDNRFCLTGQCDVCIVEIEGGEVLRSCMKPVPGYDTYPPFEVTLEEDNRIVTMLRLMKDQPTCHILTVALLYYLEDPTSAL